MSTDLALPVRLGDLVEEYDRKAAAVDDEIAAFEAAMTRMTEAACIGGEYAGPTVHPRPNVYERQVRKLLLMSAWKRAWKLIGVDQIASATDKQKWERSLADPPPFTFENLRATFGDYVARPRHHVLRALAEVFVGLDPSYRSHSKVKIGVKALPKRVILPGFSGWGSHGVDKLRDILNALAAYRGEQLIDWPELRAAENIRGGLQRVAGEAVIRRQTIRTFYNGNAHLIFDAQACLDINRALAEFYGEVLPDMETYEPTRQPSRAVAKDLQYYPTPQAVIDRVLSHFPIRADDMVLEPSCGCGRLLDAIRERTSTYLGIEVDAHRASTARAKGHPVVTANFLDQVPDPKFDVVFMNPPFYGRHYVLHVEHAKKFLKPGGRLVAILPASAHYDHGELDGGQWHDLPPASFADSGTNVPTGYFITSRPRAAAVGRAA